MADVKFLRGLAADLPSSTSDIVDGALYFTTDSKRLFLGNGTGANAELLPIAEGITTVTSINSLPLASEHTGEFYYIPSNSSSGSSPSDTTGNILAWSNGTNWLQTNIDTRLADNQSSVFTVNNNGEIEIEFTDTAGTTVYGTFTVAAGTSNVAIGKNANDELTISVDPDTTYALSTAADNDDVVVNLTPSQNGSALQSGGSSVKFIDSTSVNVSRDASGNIQFSVKPDGVGGIRDFDALVGTGSGASASVNGFTFDLEASDGTSFITELDPTIRYGASANQVVHFESGEATLSVPTVSEMNSAIATLQRTLNAMTYKGVVDDSTDITGATLHNGDVFLADANFTINSKGDNTGTNKSVEPGYLIVVQGNEDSDGIVSLANATFDVIAGDQTDTQYVGSTISHGLELLDSSSGTVASLNFVAGTSINLSDSTSTVGSAISANANEITVSHANVTRSDTNTPASGASDDDRGSATQVQGDRESLTFMVIDEITTNAQGHVTGVNYKKVTVKDTQIDTDDGTWVTTATGSTSNGVTTVEVEHENGGELGLMSFNIASSSLALSGSNDTVTINLEWGSF